MPAFAAVPDFKPASGFQADAVQAVQMVLMQVQQLGAVGILAFIALYVLATIALIPASLLTLGAGAVYGVVPGSIYVAVGATLGALSAFLIGRYLARDWVKQKIETNPKFKSVDQAVGREGFKIVLLTRLSPIFPFTLLNYALGITRVSLQDYALGCIGMLPGTVLYVYIGSLASDLTNLDAGTASANPWLQWSIRGVGFAATAAITIYLAKLARQALADSVSEPDSSSSSGK